MIRYVGLDLLFTSSPLYPPYFTADQLPDRVDLDVNTVEGLPGVDASREFIKRDLFFRRCASCRPASRSAQDYQDLPFSGDFRRCFEGEFPFDPEAEPFSCFPQYGLPPDANLFLAGAFNQRRFLEGDGDYEAGLHQLRDARTRRRRSATPTTTGSTARRAACSASSRPASWRPATGSRRR